MDLRMLGLNKFESMAYETLVRIGKSSANKISSLSGVPQGRIYDVLESLSNKGLVVISPEQPRQYFVKDPSVLLGLAEERKKELKKLEEEIKSLEKSFKTKPDEVVSLTKGKLNFAKWIRELPKSKREGYSIRYTVDFNPEWVRNTKSGIKRGVKTKSLVRYDEETARNIKKWRNFGKGSMRKIPNEGVAISIADDDHVLIGLIKSETQLVIRDKPFVKLMKELINGYWKTAEKIK